jgi:hypothetical protein
LGKITTDFIAHMELILCLYPQESILAAYG